ncbi:osteoclast stimulatory transmembrane protein isoform X2 [Petromyzon marinus]|uniref:osteoclast stimulatory transmembrane protein isoform X2 n=1 Tax=Petromyzon marinus TaxID=7757 RepID=UPI003F70B5BB
MRRRDSAMRKHSPQQNRPPLATMNDSRDRPKVTFCASAQLLRAAYSVYRLPHATTRGERGLLLALCLLTSTLSSCFVLKVVWEAEEVRPPIRLGVTATYVALTAALLFSSKQLRCISLLVVPALGTKRGREYILYAAAGLLAVHTAPNTFHNLRALGEVSLCKALSGIRSVINNSARREAVVREYATVETQTVKGLLQFHSVQSNYVFDVKTRDVSTELDSLRLKVENVTRNVAANFKTFQATVEKVRAVLSTVFSVASVLLVLALSAAYLRSYLTNVLFDNIYITEELRALARQTDPSGEAMRCLKADGRRQLVDSTSLRLSRKETENWPLSILTLFTWLLLVSLAIGVEYGVYALTDTLLALADTIPPAHAEVRLYYEVYIDQTFQNRRYLTKVLRRPNFTLEFARCHTELSPPAPHATIGVYALLLLALVLVFLGSYAYRLRRKIAASFFPEVESRRVLQLHARMKTLHRHRAGQQPAPEQLPEQGLGLKRWKGAGAPKRVAGGGDRSEVSVSAGQPVRDKGMEPIWTLPLRQQLEQALTKR